MRHWSLILLLLPGLAWAEFPAGMPVIQPPDLSYLQYKPIPYTPPARRYKFDPEQFQRSFEAGRKIGQAIRQAEEARARRKIQRVEAAEPLCDSLRSEIIAGSSIALQACLGLLLD